MGLALDIVLRFIGPSISGCVPHVSLLLPVRLFFNGPFQSLILGTVFFTFDLKQLNVFSTSVFFPFLMFLQFYFVSRMFEGVEEIVTFLNT